MRANGFVLLGILIFTSCQSNPYKQGERLYDYYCSNCHMADGNGLLDLYPSLTSQDYKEQFSTSFVCIVKNGLSDTIIVDGIRFDIPMQGNAELTSAEIANIYNYIAFEWHPELNNVTEQDVDRLLKACE